MLDGMHDAAYVRGERTAPHPGDADAPTSPGSLDELLAELISQSPEISLSSIAPVFDGGDETLISQVMIPEEKQPDSDLPDTVVDAPLSIPTPEALEPGVAATVDTDFAEKQQEDLQATAELMPARVYSMSDLMLFERLTSYRLVAQRQLWRSVDKDGNRAMAGDRLFTVLAEEAFQLADRQRRNGSSPHADLTVRDIFDAMKPMRAIAAHLGERGHQAADRLEAVLTAALNWRQLAA